MSQTAVQQANTITFGSGKFEVSPYGGGGYVNLGAMRSIVFEETWTENKIMSDNAGILKTTITDHVASLSGDLMEIDLTNLNQIRGGVDILTPIAAAPVVGASQVVMSGDWAYNKFIPLDHSMGDGSVLTVTSATGSTDGLLVVKVDYDNVLVGAVNGITITDSATVTTLAQNITIIYTYTPNASKTLSSGGKYVITPNEVKITNTNTAGEDFIIKLYKAANASGITINLTTDESGEPNATPIKLSGSLDVLRASGDQLFIITSEQL
jgi:hypothetical protein